MARKKDTRRRHRPARPTLQLPECIKDLIETERRRLNKAAAVLVGAELTAEYCPEMEVVTDAIGVARELVESAIAALDSVRLSQPGLVEAYDCLGGQAVPKA